MGSIFLCQLGDNKVWGLSLPPKPSIQLPNTGWMVNVSHTLQSLCTLLHLSAYTNVAVSAKHSTKQEPPRVEIG